MSVNNVILIVDDSKDITDILKKYVQKEGYTTVCAYDGEEAVELFRKCNPVLVLLDVMLPKINGINVCKIIRKESNVPIIMITAKSEDADRVLGLDTGADDYIIKPFSPREVLARIRAVMRRADEIVPVAKNESKRVEIAGLIVDMDSYEVSVDGKPVVLTKKEIEILWLFVTNPTKVFTRDHLLENIWGYEYFGDTRTVDTHIKRMRAKLDIDENTKFDIRTIWGVGYKFEVKQVV